MKEKESGTSKAKKNNPLDDEKLKKRNGDSGFLLDGQWGQMSIHILYT